MVESRFLEERHRITTGFIEPHFFAGFSGGPKMVAPGLAALDTVLELHSAARIGDPSARWGVTYGNPIHDAIREIARRADITFNLDVTLDAQRRLTGVYAGDLEPSHSEGCRRAKGAAMVAVSTPYDVVITTNGGYPLDQNLYQSIKGMSAAAQIVKVGGLIIAAVECSDGLPTHGGYGRLLASAVGPIEFLKALKRSTKGQHDQWQVQIQAMILSRARVSVKATGLSEEQLRAAWFEPVADIGEELGRVLQVKPNVTVAILPEGPQTVPYVA
jgi:nickel-dependent lactate racemase